MTLCRKLWAGLVSLLIPLFASSDMSAAEVPAIPSGGVLRYFHYWSEYGPKASRPDGLERIRFEVQRSQLYVSQGRPRPDTFRCQTDGSMNRELVPVLAALELSDWPGQMEDSALYDLSDRQKERLCRWHLSAVFEPAKPGGELIRFSFSGADDGTSPRRLAAEKAFRDFFEPKVEALKASTPRRLTGLLWLEKGSAYKFDLEDGIAIVERRMGAARVRMAVRSDLADKLDALVRASGLEKHHGFLQRAKKDEHRFSLYLSYDTQQRIEIYGHSGPGGMPEGFTQAFVPFRQALDEALSPPASSKALPPTVLKALSFHVSGMRIGEDIRLYERMDREGPVLVLSRNLGHSPDSRREAVLDAAQAAALEALLQKHGVRAWNGFKGRPRMHVLDGEGFSFSVTFRDGTSIAASGENKFPGSYHAFRLELNDYADTVLGPQE